MSQYPLDATEPSQYPIEASVLSQHPLDAVAGSESQRATRIESLTQYPLEVTDLSQYPIDSLTRLSVGSKSSGISSARSSVDDILMLNSKDSRPSTVIERPDTEGYNKSDEATPTNSTLKSNQSGAFIAQPQKQSVIDPHLATVANVHDIDSTFDQSIKFGHGINRQTLGDTELMPYDRHPVSSSTPFAVVNKSNARNLNPTAVENLGRYFKMADVATGNESESDSNINKFMRKAGIDDYVSADKRESLLSDFGIAQPQLSSNKSSPSQEVELITADKGGDAEETREVTLKSPNWRELIPDTPSFAHPGCQRSSGVSEHFSMEGGNQGNGSNVDRYD